MPETGDRDHPFIVGQVRQFSWPHRRKECTLVPLNDSTSFDRVCSRQHQTSKLEVAGGLCSKKATPLRFDDGYSPML